MSKVSFIISPQSVTFMVGTEPFVVASSSPQYAAVVDHLKLPDHDEATLVRIATPAGAIAQAVQDKVEVGYLPAGRIVVKSDSITYNGRPLNTVLVERILTMLSEGFDIDPWVEFLGNLFQNPVDSARDELYEFLEKANLPITPDGHFLAYKIVGPDFKDLHSGTFDNSPGKVVTVPRETVDTNRHNLCSTGLHFCSKSYLPHYGTAAGNKVVVVKINPADVVSIPTDYDYSKGRTWKYEVIGEIDRGLAAEKAWASVWAPPAGEQVSFEDAGPDEDVDDVVVVYSKVAGPLTPDALLALHKQHGSWNAIARHFGVSTGTVSSWVDKLGLR